MNLVSKEQKSNIKVEQITTDYRANGRINQSLLKAFDKSRKDFYRQYVLKESKEEKTSYSMLLGSIVDFIVLECGADFQEFEQRLEEKFYLYDGVRGDGQMFDLVDMLFNITLRDRTEDGVSTSDFSARFSEAFDIIQAQGKFKGKTVVKAIELFTDSKEADYYKAKIDSIGKTVIDLRLLEKAKQIATKVISDVNVGGVFLRPSDDDFHVYTHLVIEWEYETLFGDIIECKQEVDKLDVNHKDKTVQPYDAKAVYDTEGFEYSYLKYGYYIQQAFYTLGIRQWMNENGMEDYTQLPFKFIVIDTSVDNMKPLLFVTDEEDFKQALTGFSINGRKYSGLRGLFEEINWALNTGIFDISKDNYDSNQIVDLNINYE